MDVKQGAAQPRGRDAPLRWGEAREMNAFEALMWRAEADPRLRSTICGLELLDCVPDWQRFVAAGEWATRMVPRFRQKVVEPAFGFGSTTTCDASGSRSQPDSASCWRRPSRWR